MSFVPKADPHTSIDLTNAFPRRDAHVVVAESDTSVVHLLDSVLTGAGFDMQSVLDGEGAVSACRQGSVDVVLMDLDLPGISGEEACRRIREFSDVYIVMLTGRSEEIDKVVTFSLGADDYLTKPFSSRELVSRIHAMLRRPRRIDLTNRARHERTLVVDDHNKRASVDGELLPLTPTELKLTQALVNAAPQALSRRELIQAVWGSTATNDGHLVDVHLSNLRRKLRKAGFDRSVQNDRGVGFRMTIDVEVVARRP